MSPPDPRLALIKAWVFFVPESRDPAVSGSDPTQRGPEPILGVWFAPVEVLDLTRRSSLYIQGSGTFPWGPDPLLIPWSISSFLATWRFRHFPMGSGPTVDTLEYIIFSGHVAVPDPPMRRGQTLL
jgi:hypothetical protein